MSEIRYSSSSAGDSWAHGFYNIQGASTMFDGRDRVSSEATVISTTIYESTAANVPSHLGSSSSNNSNVPNNQLDGGGGGRISKPMRRRSRASRRTPTTLLNTDTTNFRAMVQQFTGGPTAPYASSASESHTQYAFPRGGSSFSFGNQALNSNNNPGPPSSFYHLQFQQQQQRQQQNEQYYQQQQQAQQQQQPYMFSFMNNNNNSRPEMGDINDHATGGFSIDHVPNYPLPPAPRPPPSMP